jgi:hypothetical protein
MSSLRLLMRELPTPPSNSEELVGKLLSCERTFRSLGPQNKDSKEMLLEEKDGNQGRIVDHRVHNSGFPPRKGRL